MDFFRNNFFIYLVVNYLLVLILGEWFYVVFILEEVDFGVWDEIKFCVYMISFGLFEGCFYIDVVGLSFVNCYLI